MFTFGNGALGKIHKLRSAGLSRGLLLPCFARLLALLVGQPDRSATGAFPLRRMTFASRQPFASR